MGSFGSHSSSLIVILVMIVVMVFSAYHCASNKKIDLFPKIVLVIAIVFVPYVGAIIYWIIAFYKYNTANVH